jgi:hypothetical protein
MTSAPLRLEASGRAVVGRVSRVPGDSNLTSELLKLRSH